MADVTYTVQNKNGSYDGDMVVKQYTSINIDTGDTVTVDQPTRGLMILCQGDCTINGTLSMKGRGAFADPTASGASDSNAVDSNGLRLPFLTSGGSDTLTAANTLFNGCGTAARNVLANFRTLSGDGTIVSLIRQGANGGNGAGSKQNGNAGSNGSTGQTGGGGSGGSGWDGSTGNGAYGSCFSGGSASGGTNNDSSANAGNWGGAGTNGNTSHTACTSGGVGNPTGGNDITSGSVSGTQQGTGGLIILIVKGNLTIGASGSITCIGSNSGSCNGGNGWHGSGGASGGGNIVLAYKGTYTNNGTVTANGGTAGSTAGNSTSKTGANGGNGSVQTLQIL
tara:strand:+ start:1087 stop:2100 length:1014 start_codon:yes stop_codon:yes gene_type:complete